MMNGSINVKGKTIKSFSFILENGQNFILNETEAKYIRDYLNSELPEPKDVKVMSYKEYAPGLSKKIEDEAKNKPVPDGYFEIFRTRSEPRNGHVPYTYVYYKDPAGNYGYQVENGHKYPFVKLGKISNPQSMIGKFVRSIPTQTVTRNWFKENRIQSNNQNIKALTDILEHLGYIKKKPFYGDLRKPHTYERTNMITGLEVENNHDEPEKVHTIYPSQSRQQMGS